MLSRRTVWGDECLWCSLTRQPLGAPSPPNCVLSLQAFLPLFLSATTSTPLLFRRKVQSWMSLPEGYWSTRFRSMCLLEPVPAPAPAFTRLFLCLLVWFVLSEVKLKVAQLCPTLWDPMDFTVHGILQARILGWVAFPFSRGISPTQGSKPGLPRWRRVCA